MGDLSSGVPERTVDIRLTEDLMKVEVDLYPPVEGRPGITIDGVITRLEDAGVTWGIDRPGLEKALLTCLTDGRIVRGVVAASGLKPVKSVPSYWHLKKRLMALPEADLGAQQVDYRERSPFITIKKGEPIAKRIPEEAGQPGRNVAGELLPAGEKDIVQFRPGEHILEREGILYAACSGRFEIRDRVMSVNETLDIAGNVDYSTGHIAFPGDVIIHGSVCDGFQVAAGRSIFVKQTMDASRVLSRGDLIVDGGIKGRGEGIVRVQGRVSAKFIENASIETHGDITVSKSVMHTRIRTLGTVDLGEAGVLVGGDLMALKGVRTARIGRPDSPPAVIRIGIDYLVERKIRSTREQIERLEAKRDRLRSRQNLSSGQMTLIRQVDDVIERMLGSEKELTGALYPNRGGLVVVLGEADAGTDIHIGELSLRLVSPVKGVVFFYDPDGPRIATREATKADRERISVATAAGGAAPVDGGTVPGSGTSTPAGGTAAPKDSEPSRG